MAINMRTVKNIEFNNKQVKKIEDANGNILWEKYDGPVLGVKSYAYKIYSYNIYQAQPRLERYWSISQLSSAISSPTSITDASSFYLFTENQILALLDDDFDFEDGTYNNERIGSLHNDGYFYLKTPNWSGTRIYVYIGFIQNSKIYFVSNKATNVATNNHLLGYTDDYTNAYKFTRRFTSSGDKIEVENGSCYAENVFGNAELKYYSSGADNYSTTTKMNGIEINQLPYQSITNPNANN